MMPVQDLLKLHEKTEAELEILEQMDIDSTEVKEKLEALDYQIVKEASRLDGYIMSMHVKKAKLEEFKKELQEAMKLIDSRIKKLDSAEDWIMKNTLPKLVNRKGTLETPYKRYTMYLTDGELKILDQSKIPAEFITTKIDQVVDKVKLRKYVKENNPDWATIPKVPRVKIT